jgi:hypothetical protein
MNDADNTALTPATSWESIFKAATSATFMDDSSKTALTRVVSGTLKSAQHAHPEKLSKDMIHSITKRIVGQMTANFEFKPKQPKPPAAQ